MGRTGRPFKLKKEPTTSLSAFVVDSSLIDDEQAIDESKPETLRRIFTTYFGEDRIKEKQREIRKKLDRHALLHGNTGDQSRIDSLYFPRGTVKDCVYSRKDLIDIVIEGRGLSGELRKRNADDSITKAMQRGDVERIDGGFRIIRKWWLPMEQVTN